ncbi:MAG TPA: DUF1851 domain-containing protein [Cyclobacteriaceae bacterium]|nr:DUF1851 domain-containing protein [Cyclobacteriaceae bacterium]HMV11136.1 DUF1851 domain-containing protein [Cyclobacteriaceae bacterium]HMV90885.1 DUF1851 domain-containing protein [Cyclobacteriaceae bacterium]HMX01753.1 DUF1851 domain-containing protein [Cyclobacteriaceae bacterium]HMX51500.1 DUF1851 domain-containing protein [Cyclobacteriaceae bacterium]
MKFDENASNKLIRDWTWLTGTDKTPIMVSSIGDLFLKDKTDRVFWLNTGNGTLTAVADAIEMFREKLQDQDVVNDWFLVDLIDALKTEGKRLKPGQVYSYRKLIVLGGDYTPDNFEPTDIEVHFSFAGQIHQQVKDLPPGTKIDLIKFIPGKD